MFFLNFKVPAWRGVFTLVLFLGCATSAVAGDVFMTSDVTITAVAVNGGADTANPGTACIKISNSVAATCTGGYIAIKNNNKLLISAALTAKSTGAKVWAYYVDGDGSNHCPGLVFTPCSLISIQLN